MHCLCNLVFDIRLRCVRLNDDGIGDACHTAQMSNFVAGITPLVLPIDRTCQRHTAIFDVGLQIVLPKNRAPLANLRNPLRNIFIGYCCIRRVFDLDDFQSRHARL